MNQHNIKCPNCSVEIDIDALIGKQMQAKYQKQFEERVTEQNQLMDKQKLQLQKEAQSLEEAKQKLNEMVDKTVETKLSLERKKAFDLIKKQVLAEKEDEITFYKVELEKSSSLVKEHNLAKAELEKAKRTMGEMEGRIKLESEEKMSKELNLQRKAIQEQEERKWQLKTEELEKKIEDANRQMKEAQRKIEQGSVQMQGEVLELAIQRWLQQSFPLDLIEEIRKGIKGGDCLQLVKTMTGQDCGSIYYESKRTKEFQKDWIQKFKTDMRVKNAFIGVIVTEAMPRDMARMGQREGVWICTFEEFKGLCFVLRESLILLNNVSRSQENKGEKMNMLYDFLSSHEFRMQLEAIVEGFTQMTQDLESEKRAMESVWKKREKQIKKVMLNTSQMYGSIRGIAGDSISPITLLELPTK